MAPSPSKPQQQTQRAGTPMPGTAQAEDPACNPDLSFASTSSGFNDSQAHEASFDETESSQSEGEGHVLGSSDSSSDSRDEADETRGSIGDFVVSDTDSCATNGWTSSSSSSNPSAPSSALSSAASSPCKSWSDKRHHEDDDEAPAAKKTVTGASQVSDTGAIKCG